MTRIEITEALEAEIVLLQQVRQLLEGSRELNPSLQNLVHQKQPAVAQTNSTVRVRSSSTRQTTRHKMSEEGRRRIVEAQKRRWARVRGL